MTARLTPELLLEAYRQGIFPMAESRHDPEVFWVDPRRRGVIPLDGFHASRSLRRTLRGEAFRVTLDAAFADVIAGCGGREETWINATILDLSLRLHRLGFARSVEVWEGEALVGGVYGLAIGAAYFGESMFSRRTDASKVALAHLVERLRAGGFRLFDTQFLTPHLASLGGVEVSRARYRALLAEAVAARAVLAGPMPSGAEVAARL